MGTSQILMIAAVVIIVGIAAVVAITQFGATLVQANEDAVLQDCQSIVQAARAWYRKPVYSGGGSRSWTGITLVRLNVDSTNENGSYSLSSSGDNLTVTGKGNVPVGDGNVVQVAIVYNAAKDSLGAPTITRVSP